MNTKYQIPIIATGILAAVLVLAMAMNASMFLPSPDPADNDLTHFIKVETTPSEIDGLNRRTPYLPPTLTEQDLVHEKIKQGVVYVMGASNVQIQGEMIFSTDHPPSKYSVVQLSAFGSETYIYVTHDEFNQYQSWADENLIPKGVDHDFNRYYFEYDGEVVEVIFMDEENIQSYNQAYTEDLEPVIVP